MLAKAQAAKQLVVNLSLYIYKYYRNAFNLCSIILQVLVY
jgi:hypothetical protein